MKLEDINFKKTFGDIPDSFERRVQHTLHQTKAEAKSMKKITFRTSLILAALLMFITAVAYALITSPTADIFGWFYGENKKEELLSGDIAPSGASYRLGDVVYTLDEAIYKDGFIYGTGFIRPAEGANVILIPDDYGIHEAASHLLHYGQETIPEDVPSYAELAEERGATILLAQCVADGILEADGTMNAAEVGYTQLPQPDGSIRFTFEFQGGGTKNDKIAPTPIERSPSYDVQLHIANWEITPSGVWLREGSESTLLQHEWIITISPTMKGE